MKTLKTILSSAVILTLPMQLAFSDKGQRNMNRLKINEDRYRLEALLSKPDHSLYLGVKAALNTNITTVEDDLKKASKVTGTDDEKREKALEILNKHMNTEQYLYLDVGLGVPLPSFNIKGVDIVPQVSFGARVSALMGISSENVTVQNLEKYIPASAPPELKNAARNVSQADLDAFFADDSRTDIVQLLVDVDPSIAPVAAPYLGRYIVEGSDSPTAGVSGKVDMNLGTVGAQFFHGPLFGGLDLSLISRRDLDSFITASKVANKEKVIKFDNNSQLLLMSNLMLGYSYDIFSGYVALEEIRLGRLKSSNRLKYGDLIYGTPALLRLHADADLKLSIFRLNPFLGLIKRSGYGVSDGLYVGGNAGASLLSDIIRANVRLTFDKEHITFAPRVGLSIVSLQYSLKQPVKSRVDGYKVSTMHSGELLLAYQF